MKLKNAIICVCVMLLMATGCGKKQNMDVKTKGKCNVFTCMEKLSDSQSIEEMNETIGFEAELESEEASYKKYKWELSENSSITAMVMSSGSKRLDAHYDLKIINMKADFSKWDQIKKRISSKDLTYSEFVKLVGNVEGIITRKESDVITYHWYNKDGGYLFADFDTETGMCKLASGRF